MSKTVRIKNVQSLHGRRKLGAMVRLCGHNTAFMGRIGITHIVLAPHGVLKEHRHERSESLFYILRGAATLTYGNQRKAVVVHPNDIINIPPRAWHGLTALEKGLEYLAVQSPPIQYEGSLIDTIQRRQERTGMKTKRPTRLPA